MLPFSIGKIHFGVSTIFIIMDDILHPNVNIRYFFKNEPWISFWVGFRYLNLRNNKVNKFFERAIKASNIRSY